MNLVQTVYNLSSITSCFRQNTDVPLIPALIHQVAVHQKLVYDIRQDDNELVIKLYEYIVAEINVIHEYRSFRTLTLDSGRFTQAETDETCS